MFEARLVDGVILRQIMDSVKDLVRDANMDVTEEELQIQCMDAAHVSLIDVQLSAAAFDQFRCDKAMSLGFNSENMTKIMKMMNKDDTLILKAEDDADKLTLMFECPDSKTIADFGE
jgi:proliferating cell nuclear antigen